MEPSDNILCRACLLFDAKECKCKINGHNFADQGYMIKFVNKNIEKFPNFIFQYKNVTFLICPSNNIKEINILPPFLESFICDNNKIKQIDQTILPITLKTLSIDNNFIEKLDISETNITNLSISNNNLKSIKTNNVIKGLTVDNNSNILIDFNNITNLEYICASNCKLNNIENFPKNIVRVYIYGNEITSIDHIFENIKYLNCTDNKIKEIKSLPNSLEHLYISKNKLEELKINIPNLIELYCSSNYIKKLEILTESLIKLICNDNPLEYLFNQSIGCSFYYNAIFNNSNLIILPLTYILKVYDCYNKKKSALELDNIEKIIENSINYKYKKRKI